MRLATIISTIALVLVSGCSLQQSGAQSSWLEDVLAYYQEGPEDSIGLPGLTFGAPEDLPGFTALPIAEWYIDEGKSNSVTNVLRNDRYEAIIVIRQVKNYRNESVTSSEKIFPDIYTSTEGAIRDPYCETIWEPREIDLAGEPWHIMRRSCATSANPTEVYYFRGPLSRTNNVQYHGIVMAQNTAQKDRREREAVAQEAALMLTLIETNE